MFTQAGWKVAHVMLFTTHRNLDSLILIHLSGGSSMFYSQPSKIEKEKSSSLGITWRHILVQS